MIRRCYRLGRLVVLLLACAGVLPAQDLASTNDPVLRAMLAEMQRSKSQLKLPDVQAPYYVDYRLVDVDQYVAEAAFGAVRTALANACPHAAHRGARGRLQAGQLLSAREKALSMWARSTTTKPDCDTSFGWAPTGPIRRPRRPSPLNRRNLKKYSVDEPVDDFAHASPVQFVGAAGPPGFFFTALAGHIGGGIGPLQE